MFDDDLGLDDGDLDLGGEVSESRIQRLVESKRRLEVKMAVSGAREQRRIARRLARIDKVLDKSNISTVRRKPIVDGVDGMVFEKQPPPGPGRLSWGQTDYSALYLILGIEAPSDPRIHPIRVVRGDSDK
jgi:hypothetical protein